MDTSRHLFPGTTSRGALAGVVAAALLVGGVMWQWQSPALGADARSVKAATALQAPARWGPAVQSAPALAAGRTQVDSYADIVTAVGAGVVTIRVEETTRVSPTGLLVNRDGRGLFLAARAS